MNENEVTSENIDNNLFQIANDVGILTHLCNDDLILLSEKVGISKKNINIEIKKILVEKLLLWLIGEIDTGLNFEERVNKIKFRFNSLFSEEVNFDINRIAKIQIAIVNAMKSQKESISSYQFTESLLKDQNYRCSVCGVPLREEFQKESDKFPQGIEPIFPPELDHVLPFYLLGNNQNYQILCKYCNGLKYNHLGSHEQGEILNGNHLKSEKIRRNNNDDKNKRRVAFWTIFNSPFCSKNSCTHSSRNSTLWVSKSLDEGTWSLGNLKVLCENHATSTAFWVHSCHTNT